MSDPVTFLGARLDEDEAVANEVGQHLSSMAAALTYIVPVDTPNGVLHRKLGVYDPARVLREVQAKRRIVDVYVRTRYLAEGMGRVEMYAVVKALENVVGLHAAVYSDHADYNPKWAPA